ncbi:hypothetical protein ACFQO4_09060 [Saliphagus sp. GCM10025334]
MGYEHHQKIDEEDRRAFLKALGVVGAVSVGGATISEVREEVGSGTAEEFASIGRAIESDLSGTLDAEFLATQQGAFAELASELPAVVERGVPEAEPRTEFASVAEAGRPIYDHLVETGFFESTTSHLPEFTPEYVTSSAEAFVGSEALTAPLEELGFSEEVAVDLLVPMVNRAEELSHYHWVATDKIPREQIELGETIPAMTRAAAGGVLLWLEDLDGHLWQKQVLLTDDIVADAVWDAQAMAAGFHLMTEGARAIGAESSELSDGELGALLSTSFAVQAIGQALLPPDAYWITEEMRASQAQPR